jgi:hypothetical protein
MTGIKVREFERWKHRRKPKPQAMVAPTPTPTPVDQARVNKWIHDRLIQWDDSCWQCRHPINVGQQWVVIGNGEVATRFHKDCHDAWRMEQESAARLALGLA